MFVRGESDMFTLRGWVRWVTGALVVAAAVTGGLRIKTGVAAAGGPTYARVVVPDLALGPAAAPAHLSKDQALSVATAALSPTLFTHPYTVDYGSFDDTTLRAGSAGRSSVQAVGARDTWKFTITGLDVVRPCPVAVPSACPPPISTLVVFIDDKSGTMLEAQGY
jgi:hypothetical protein